MKYKISEQDLNNLNSFRQELFTVMTDNEQLSVQIDSLGTSKLVEMVAWSLESPDNLVDVVWVKDEGMYVKDEMDSWSLSPHNIYYSAVSPSWSIHVIESWLTNPIFVELADRCQALRQEYDANVTSDSL